MPLHPMLDPITPPCEVYLLPANRVATCPIVIAKLDAATGTDFERWRAYLPSRSIQQISAYWAKEFFVRGIHGATPVRAYRRSRFVGHRYTAGSGFSAVAGFTKPTPPPRQHHIKLTAQLFHHAKMQKAILSDGLQHKSGTHLLSRSWALPSAVRASRCCSEWEAVLPLTYMHQKTESDHV